MNKSNFQELGKAIIIILFFLIIIGLVFIVSNPIKFNTMIFGNKIIEGNANIGETINKCHNCLISPSKGDGTTDFRTPIHHVDQYIKTRIEEIKANINYKITMLTNTSRSSGDISGILSITNGLSTNLYADTSNNYDKSSVHYVFCSWKGGNYNTVSGNYLEECNNVLYTDTSCCLTTSNIQSQFYKNNYLTDNLYNISYNGILFKYSPTSSRITLSNEILQNAGATTTIDDSNHSSNLTYVPVTNISAQELTFVNRRFTYNTNISTADSVTLTINGENKVINCNGNIQEISVPSANFANCNIANITELTNNERINLNTATQKCWDLATQKGQEVMSEYCSFKSLDYQTCSGNYLPNNFTISGSLTNPPSYTDIDNILYGSIGTGGNTGSSSIIGISGENSSITPQIQNVIQEITDNLVNSFNNRLNSLNQFSGQSSMPEYGNIGVPTYLNIGNCDSNSPYVYNSSCLNQNDSNNQQNQINQSGGFLYTTQCYPSLTGQFKECGPPGYQPKPDF